MGFSFSSFFDKVRETVGEVITPVLAIGGGIFGGPAGAAAGAAAGQLLGGFITPTDRTVLAPRTMPGVVPMVPAPLEGALVAATPARIAAGAAGAPTTAGAGGGIVVLGLIALALFAFAG